MKKAFFNKLCCPFDKADLNLKIIKEDNDEILEGLMSCTECDRYFPVIFGIPVMTPDEYRQLHLEEPVLKRWGLQLDEKSKTPFRLTEGG